MCAKVVLGANRQHDLVGSGVWLGGVGLDCWYDLVSDEGGATGTGVKSPLDDAGSMNAFKIRDDIPFKCPHPWECVTT